MRLLNLWKKKDLSIYQILCKKNHKNFFYLRKKIYICSLINDKTYINKIYGKAINKINQI